MRKKWILWTACALFGAFVLVSCGKKEEESRAQPVQTAPDIQTPAKTPEPGV